LIQEGLEQSKRDFDSFLEENVQIEWDAQRKRIYEHFGLGRQSEDMAASQSTFGRSARGAFGRSTRKGRSMGPAGASPNASFGTSTAAPVLGSINSSYQQRAMNGALDKSVGPGQGTVPDRFERDKQEQFAEKVKELNISRIEDRPYHILRSFYEVEKGSDTEHQEHFLNTYKALISITGEKDTLSGTNKARERAFAREYLDDNPNSANSVNIRKRILTGSRKFLEQKFLGEAVAVVAKHAGETKPGGIPSLLNKIRAYIQVKVSFKELGDVELLQRIGGDGEEFPWVILFYLLRAGLVQEASDYVRAKKNFFQNNDRIFALAMLYYADDSDRRLNPELQQKMNHVYAQRARISPTNDPFRMACYKIVGRCELTRRNLEPLPQTMDDWVWLQFNLAREGNRAEENAGEIFGLEEIRTSINVIGQRHFTSPTEAAGGYGVYFYLATLAGMFEQAINYLGGHNMTTAVHFAIALDFYGLLRVSDWSKAGSEIRRLSFQCNTSSMLIFDSYIYTTPSTGTEFR
jgi:nuclear pore complex protein Nup93